MRRDAGEKEKLDRIAKELNSSDQLQQVDIRSHDHERATNQDFNNKMSVNLRQILKDAMKDQS